MITVDDVPVPRPLAGLRRHALDGALLLFDREDGLSAVLDGPETRALRRTAPRVVQLAITNRCNLACAFCHRDTDAASGWTADDAFALLADLARAGTLEVAFGGGEPFAFRGFDGLVHRLHDETPLAVSVTTNGLLVDRARARALRGAVAQLRVSLYDDNDWRDRIALLADEGHVVGANLLVLPERLPRLEETIFALIERGCRDVLLLSYLGADEAQHLTRRQSDALAARVATLARALAGRATLKLSVCWGERLEAAPQALIVDGDCGAGRDFVSITSDRRVAACSFHHATFPIRTAEDVLAVWRGEPALATPSRLAGCARPARPSTISPVDVPRLRLYRAFASNNSGSYTLVGSFRSAETAKALAEELDAIVHEHGRWLLSWTPTERPPGEPPLHRYVRAQGLTLESDQVGLDDDWPPSPDTVEVTSVGHQLFVYCGSTLELPRVLGEVVYRRGGRVDVELVHAHHPLVCQLTLWTRMTEHTDAARLAAMEKLAAFRRVLEEEVLPPLLSWPPYDERKPIAPAWQSAYAALEMYAVFPDPIAGVAAVRDAAARHGVEVQLKVTEAATDDTSDLLSPYRAAPRPYPGRWQVILWQAGERVETLKAIREVTHAPLAEVREKLADLPTVLVEHVSEDEARRCEALLRAVGADAEALGPQHFRRP